jgi:hypothetical protein
MMTNKETQINTALSILLKDQKIAANVLLKQLNKILPEAKFTPSDITRAQTLDYWAEPVVPVERIQKLGKKIKAPLLLKALLTLLNASLQNGQDGLPCLKNNTTGQEWPLLYATKIIPAHEIPSNQETVTNDITFTAEFDFEGVLNLMRVCTTEIEILQSYLSRIDDFHDVLEENLTKFPESKVTILLLDPNHEAANLRFKGIKPMRPHEDVLEKLAKNLKNLRELESRFPTRMKVGTYNAIPAVVYYRIGDRIFAGSHFMGKYSYESCFIGLPYQLSHPYVKDLKDHWDKLWEYSNSFEDEARFTLHFKCHCLHEKTLKYMKLAIDPRTNDAKLYQTPSKRIYIGSVSSLRTGFCQMHLPDIEITDDGRTKGVASFILNLNIMDIESAELSTGIFTVNSPVERDTIYARSVIVERVKPGKHKIDQPKKVLLERFFANPKDVELANRLGAVNTWHALALKLGKT